jgi:hypothetical protein
MSSTLRPYFLSVDAGAYISSLRFVLNDLLKRGLHDNSCVRLNRVIDGLLTVLNAREEEQTNDS